MSSHPIDDSLSDDVFQQLSTDNLVNVCEILDKEPLQESPIDINIAKAIPVNISPHLTWMNFDLAPKKMKVTNTGHSVIASGKWGQERPYITNGVLSGKYVFSQMHFHWGINDMEGSEHTIDGRQFPGELHVVLFKSCYLTQESALKERDGIVILVYMLDLQDSSNPDLQSIIDSLAAIPKAHSSARLPPVQLNVLLKEFEADYFMYKGSVSTNDCIHSIMWLVTRIPISVSPDQMDSFRFLLDNDDEIIRRNFRDVQPTGSRHLFHILPSSSQYATLLADPALEVGDRVTQIYRIQLFLSNHKGTEIRKEDDDFVKDLKLNDSIKKPSIECLFQKPQAENSRDLISSTMLIFCELSKYIDLVYYLLLSTYILRLIFITLT